MSSDSPTNSRAPRKRPAAKSITPEPIPDEDYALKRQRNNAAVNKTRQKKRQEEQHTQSRVQKLRDENTQLERFVGALRNAVKLRVTAD